MEKKANVTIRWSALAGVVWWLGDASQAVTLKEVTRGYEVEDVKWFNMFPRTARFETLVVLKKRSI